MEPACLFVEMAIQYHLLWIVIDECSGSNANMVLNFDWSCAQVLQIFVDNIGFVLVLI